MPAFQATNRPHHSQFITDSCKECSCIDFQEPPSRYQRRDRHISNDDQICWGCKHKALSHRWELGEADSPTGMVSDSPTGMVSACDRADSDPYEGPINSSPVESLQVRRAKGEKDAASPNVESEYDDDTGGNESPLRPTGMFVPKTTTPKYSTISPAKAVRDGASVADSPAPKPAVAGRQKTVRWEDPIEGSHQRSHAIEKKIPPKLAGGQIESTQQNKPSATPENAPPPPPKDPNSTPTEPELPTGKLTLSGIMEYLVLRNRYDTWERRKSEAKIHSALSKIQEDLTSVKGKLGSILDDDFASAAMSTPKTPYGSDNARSHFWGHSEAQRKARSPSLGPVTSSPVLPPSTEPPRATPDPFVKESHASSAPSLRYWRDNSRHVTSKNVTGLKIRAAPPTPSPSRATAVPSTNPARIAAPQAAKQGGTVIREEIDEDYDSYDSAETEIDDEPSEFLEGHQEAVNAGSNTREPLDSRRPDGAPTSEKNSGNPEYSQRRRESIDSDGSVPFPEDKGESQSDDSDSGFKPSVQENRRDNGKSVDHEPSDIDAAKYANSRRQQTQGVSQEEDGSSSPSDSPTEGGPSAPIIHMHSGILPPPLSTIPEESPTKPFTVQMDPIEVKKPLEVPPLAPPLTTRQSSTPEENSDKPLPAESSEPENVQSSKDYSDSSSEEIDGQESTTSEYMDQTPPRKSPKVNQYAHSVAGPAAVAPRRSPRKLPQVTQYPRTPLLKRAREVDGLEIEAPGKRAKTEKKSPSKPPAAKKAGAPKLAKVKGRKKAKAVRAPSRRVDISSDDDDHYSGLSTDVDEAEVPTRRAKTTPKITSKAPKIANSKRAARKSSTSVGVKYKKSAARSPSEQIGELGELEIGELDEVNYM